MLPNVLLASVARCKSATSAGIRVFKNTLPARPTGWPILVIEQDGARATHIHQVEEARIVVHSYGQSPEQARKLAYEARDVFLPPANQVEGVHGVQVYEEEGVEKSLTFSGAVQESGPRFSPDSRNHIISVFLVQYY